jgi:hypothetical protein
MTGEMFVQWLKHFSPFVKPSQEDEARLIVDGHSTHKYVDVLSLQKKLES